MKLFGHQKCIGSLLLSLLVTQVQSSLVEDEFDPVIEPSCVGGTMTIRVYTKDPFEGIIHTGNNRNLSQCFTYGNGGLKTSLKIDLTGADGCGVKYNENTEERKVGVYVRRHHSIELLDDRLYLVRCGKVGFQNSRNQFSAVQLRVTDGTRKVNAVLEGESYHLHVQIRDHDPEYGILVKRCFAFNSQDTAYPLFDDRGCRTDKLVSEFTYDDKAGSADATIYNIFRIPPTNQTHFQCDVEICKGSCERPTCELTRQPLPGESSSNVDPFVVLEAEDTVTASTSVFVAQPGSEAALSVGYCVKDDINPDWLKYLCLAFGILFGIMLLINIFLCSAMTCSCTKTEVIEKEPSIYDDYSVYESQYGYNSKVYNSESDYGSEYGMVEGGGVERPNRAQEPPSEAGTLRSKYSKSGGDNTLSRSRSHGGSRYLE